MMLALKDNDFDEIAVGQHGPTSVGKELSDAGLIYRNLRLKLPLGNPEADNREADKAKQERHDKRRSSAQPASEGHRFIMRLYEDETRDHKPRLASGNSPINVKLHRDDLKLIDSNAARFNVTRSRLLTHFVEIDVLEMFLAQKTKERVDLAEAVDKELTASGHVHAHPRTARTWQLELDAREAALAGVGYADYSCSFDEEDRI